MLPIVKKTPVLAGVCGTDPFRVMDIFLKHVINNVPEIDGFFGASSIERLASERGMTAQAAAFKAIEK